MSGSELRPRERLLQHGPQSLTDAELLSVLLRGRGWSAVKAAERILRDVSGLPGLLVADRVALRRCGASEPRSAVILAAVEVLRRISTWRDIRELIEQPESAVRHILVHYPTVDQETMGALYLDIRNRLIVGRELFRGTIDRCSVEPRQILREALDLRAFSLILWHVHPSGDPKPSDSDEKFTMRLQDCCELLGIRLQDHLVLGSGGRFTSMNRTMRRSGLWRHLLGRA